MHTTVGQLVVNDALPEGMREYGRVVDKKTLQSLLRDVAINHPEEYVRISKRLADIGRRSATQSGGNSFGLTHMAKSNAGRKYQQLIQARFDKILNNDDLDDDARERLIIRAVGEYQDRQMDEVLEESRAEGNPLATQVLSGSRGNKMNLASLRGSDLLYTDHRDNVLPMPVLRSYSEGLRPSEYWAGTYGARKGVIDTKMAVSDAGFLSKQLNQISHRLVVVDEDDPRTDRGQIGLPVDTDDPDNEGALLGQDVGPYRRDTAMSPKILRHLKALGHDRILVRSPITSRSPDGGVYARDIGIRERGVMAGRGEMVGLTAAQALSEPLSQAQLSSKHTGGVAGQSKGVSGFAYINQLVQSPKTVKGGAAHAEADGRVDKVEPAPAGGHYVWVGGQRHYVAAGFDLKVKPGDEVEAGDVLSDGVPQPNMVVKHKGVGEGQRYFVKTMVEAMRGAGMKANRRNVEVLARGLINHVRLTDEFAGHMPDDVVPYSSLEHAYQPRDGHTVVRPDRAAGKYLERPVLHYTVGTRIRPSVLKDLQHFGVGEVAVHDDPPPFEPEMIRGMNNLHYDPDWQVRMYGSGLKTSLLDSVHHGGRSDELGTSFVPALARGVDFGHIGSIQSPQPGKPAPVRPPPVPDMPAPIKRSVDRVAAIAHLRWMAKAADATHNSFAGSSTTTAAGLPGNTAGQANKVVPPGASLPAPPVVGGPASPKPVVPVGTPSRPAAMPPPPAPTTPPAPAGTVHTDRQQALGYYPKPEDNPGVGQNPNGDGMSGYQTGNGLLDYLGTPEAAEQFVRGGGEANSPDSGFGGPLGMLTRVGSLFDANAVNVLTGGQRYVRNNYAYQDPQRPAPNYPVGPNGLPSMGVAAPGVAPPGGPGWTGYDPSFDPGTNTNGPSGNAEIPPPATVPTPAAPTPPGPRLSPAETADQVLGSPLAGELPFRAAGQARVAATKIPVINKVPGFRPPVVPTAAAATATAGGKMGAKAAVGAVGKGILKKVPLVGWAMEAHEALNTSNEEALARMDAKMNGNLPGVTGNRTADYFIDNALNIGVNLRSAYAGLDNALDTYHDAKDQAGQNQLREAATLEMRIKNLAARNPRGFTPAQSTELAQARDRLEQIYAPGNMPGGTLDAYKQKVQGEMTRVQSSREKTKIDELFARAIATEQNLAKGQDVQHDFSGIDDETRAMLERYAHKKAITTRDEMNDPAAQAAGTVLALERLHKAHTGLPAGADPKAVQAAIDQSLDGAEKYHLAPGLREQVDKIAAKRAASKVAGPGVVPTGDDWAAFGRKAPSNVKGDLEIPAYGQLLARNLAEHLAANNVDPAAPTAWSDLTTRFQAATTPEAKANVRRLALALSSQRKGRMPPEAAGLLDGADTDTTPWLRDMFRAEAAKRRTAASTEKGAGDAYEAVRRHCRS